MNKDNWWVGFWKNQYTQPLDSFYFCIQIGHIENYPPGYTGAAWALNDYSSAWEFHAKDKYWSKKVQPMCNKLRLPYVWEDWMYYHPGIKIIKDGKEVCRNIRKNKLNIMKRELI